MKVISGGGHCCVPCPPHSLWVPRWRKRLFWFLHQTQRGASSGPLRKLGVWLLQPDNSRLVSDSWLETSERESNLLAVQATVAKKRWPCWTTYTHSLWRRKMRECFPEPERDRTHSLKSFPGGPLGDMAGSITRGTAPRCGRPPSVVRSSAGPKRLSPPTHTRKCFRASQDARLNILGGKPWGTRRDASRTQCQPWDTRQTQGVRQSWMVPASKTCPVPLIAPPSPQSFHSQH